VQSGAIFRFRSHGCGRLRTFQFEQLQWWGQRPDRDRGGGRPEALSRFPPRLGTSSCQSISQTLATSTAARCWSFRPLMLLPGGDALGAGAPCPLSGSGQDVRSAEPCRLAAFSDGSVRPALFSPQFACKPRLHTRGISPGQKLRLGGDALGADPTYLLYLQSRPRGGLRRIDFEPDCAGATLSDFAASELTRKSLLHTCGISRPGAATWR